MHGGDRASRRARNNTRRRQRALSMRRGMMRSMRSATTSALLAIATLSFLAAPRAQDRALNPPLHVAFVGDLDTPRGADFVAFLRGQFARVDAVERATCTPDRLRTADVVVLDWSQADGIMKWLENRGAPRHNPLGELARWDRPTVLIGSAGLDVASDWSLPGTQG